MANTVLGMVRPHELDRSNVTAALAYALKPELLALYGVVYVGLALSDWNTVRPLFGLLYLAPAPVARLVVGVFELVTSLVGYGLTAAGTVGVLKTVLDDALRQSDDGRDQGSEDR